MVVLIGVAITVPLLVTKRRGENQNINDDVESTAQEEDSIMQSLVSDLNSVFKSFTPLGGSQTTCGTGYVNTSDQTDILVCVPGNVRATVIGTTENTVVDLCRDPNTSNGSLTYEGEDSLSGKLEYIQGENRWKLTVGNLEYVLLQQYFPTKVPLGSKKWIATDLSTQSILIQMRTDPCTHSTTSEYNRDYADTELRIPY